MGGRRRWGEVQEENNPKGFPVGHLLLISLSAPPRPPNNAESFLVVWWREEEIVLDPLFSPEITETCFPINQFH